MAPAKKPKLVTKVYLNWAKDVHPQIETAMRFFESQSVRPTLRTLFYNLVSKNVIGNTKSTYKGLSHWLVEARKMGLVPWDAFQDNARTVYGKFNDDTFRENLVETNERDLENKFEEINLANILREYFDYMVSHAYVGRWAKQPTVAEVWIEKEALAATIQKWTESLGVKIRVNKGYSSWTFLYENCRELKEYLGVHDKIVILYLGDLDPSGVDMERFLKEALNYFELPPSLVEFKRLSVTEAQVRQYNLPPKPEDAETLAKLQRDTRTANYKSDFVVELDAMVAFVPREFRALVTQAILDLWDRDIYDKLKTKAEEMNAEIDALLARIKERAAEKMANEGLS